MSPAFLRCLLLLVALPWAAPLAAEEFAAIAVDPPRLTLDVPQGVWSLLVTGRTAEGRLVDLTGQAEFRSLSPGLLRVDARGVVRGVGNGQAAVEVVAGGLRTEVPVEVTAADRQRSLHFGNEIVPILSRYGCNSSGCHGKAEGQNGFKLSVFGFDPEADYDALTKEARGRRVFLAAAERSLLLQKAAGFSPHGGGTRILPDSPAYQTLLQWVAAGCPRGADDAPTVSSIRLSPRERVLRMNDVQQLRVVATFSDGHEEDVTALAQFQSNNDGLASVNEAGLVTASDTPGNVAVMASYLGAVDTFQALIPRSEALAAWPDVPEFNQIDTLVHRRLKQLEILPSEEADDAEYLRRVYLDLLGTLPTADQARQFLNDPAADKRARLADALLQRPEFADYWALFWSDLLRVDVQSLGAKNAYAYYRWIRESMAENKPLDVFARELITAEGPLDSTPAGHFYTVVKKPGEVASTLSQVLLGVRIACAECHHHPFDRWAQHDYYGMQAYFAPLRKKNVGAPALVAEGQPQARHPRTGELVPPHPLGVSPTVPGESAAPSPQSAQPGVRADARRELADWLVSPQNAWFARNMANRVWARMLGRGLVEPVDDFRETNPPTNPELLDALARVLTENHYDVRALIRAITASRTYQLSSRPNQTNAGDEQNYSRALFKRMDAEVLFDAVCQVTGMPEKFPGVPLGARATQLWNNQVPHYFLKVFGRPTRETACECERNSEASIAQVLHLMNSPQIQGKIGHAGGRVAQLTRQITDDDALAEELYLTVFARFPSTEEREVAREHFANARQANDPRARATAAEDLLWSMLNSLEFVFNH